ncbi:uncharacterized protein LOC131156404 [Malania oleifera]|uniref:uncharacterized protein LOC131156404 n=1 Tax=Malania oleifera TaxID=397392 RepID=UPI0025AE6C64|nr:uncharacterized protein LOC131156404 [Malania oleifera]XP_057966042.1 uncharacterized protein LOC131156404 [Malania oleifera]XP_057966043.1 uncharacterized protein LOC131156404 [Malania oleifera]XP_057966044.1 uncharacterized protein LOC131156404 [Malania oleifera]XP_057966045.1 uncharacterized protein LOC131156404 [Malania oleifera]XP_057966046.1 uncharacterized protein LOC131156404 [Malania oleifera]XP_057966047.1 uncharacterized protein LOC131156404 [Malania oleifera]XP_057966049.1 unc
MVLYMRILEEFDMDILHADHVKRAVDVQLCNKFKSYRAKRHEHFRAMGDEAETHPYNKISQEDWEVVCCHFCDPHYQAVYGKNATNRSKLPTTHCGGSRLFVNHRQRYPATSAEELLLDLYQRTHQQRLGEWCDGAQSKHARMVELRDAPVEEGSQQMTNY